MPASFAFYQAPMFSGSRISRYAGFGETVHPIDFFVEWLYVYSPDTTQMLVVSFQNIGGPVNSDTLKRRLSNYNSKYYDLKGYNISSMMFDHRLQIAIVKGFENKEQAMEYYNGLLDNDEVYGNLNPEVYDQFVLSSNNFASFINEKKLEGYLDFFRHFYK